MEITVVKFTLYPKDNPTGYAVGFNINTVNGRSFYRDTLVPLEQASGLEDDDIVEEAWSALKGGIFDTLQQLEQRPPLLGKSWIPREYRPIIDEEGEPEEENGESEQT